MLINDSVNIRLTSHYFDPIGLVTFLVPCYTNGRNAEATGESCVMHAIYFLIPFVGFYCHATTRGKIREKKNIDVS